MNRFRDKLVGACELVLLFGRGVNKFDGTKKEAINSLIIPVLIYAASFIVGDLYVPPGMEAFSKTRIVLILVTQYVLSFVVTFILAYEFSRWLKRTDKFWLFVSACNWTALPLGAISLPIVFLVSIGVLPHDQKDGIFFALDLYSYGVCGCIAYSAFRLNWQLAIAVGVANMFIDLQIWHFLYLVQDLPIP